MTQLEDKYNEQDANYIIRRQKQIKNVRYMVYTFVIGIILLIFQPMFATVVDKVRGEWAAKKMISLSGSPIDNITKSRWEGGLLNEIDKLDAQVIVIQAEIQKVEGTLAIVNHLDNEQKQNTVASCLNLKQCGGVPASLMPHLTLLRNYIILDRLQAEKMDFDQRVVLKSISEFLVKSAGGGVNGQVEAINFSAPTVVDPALSLYKLPFNLTIEFPSKSMLLAFLSNVDTKVNFEFPILYAVDSVSYDAMEYENAQTVLVSMWAYYYVWEPKVVNKDHAAAGEQEADLEDLAELINGGQPTAEQPVAGEEKQAEEAAVQAQPSVKEPVQEPVPSETTKKEPEAVEQPAPPEQPTKKSVKPSTTTKEKNPL